MTTKAGKDVEDFQELKKVQFTSEFIFFIVFSLTGQVVSAAILLDGQSHLIGVGLFAIFSILLVMLFFQQKLYLRKIGELETLFVGESIRLGNIRKHYKTINSRIEFTLRSQDPDVELPEELVLNYEPYCHWQEFGSRPEFVLSFPLYGHCEINTSRMPNTTTVKPEKFKDPVAQLKQIPIVHYFYSDREMKGDFHITLSLSPKNQGKESKKQFLQVLRRAKEIQDLSKASSSSS